MSAISGALPARPSPSKRLTLLACILGSGAVFLDGTVVNVALPAIRADLHAGLAAQQWVVAAYLLTLGSLILVGGSLGDLYGRRRVFAIGVAAFGAFSLLCAAAPSAELLVAARAIQGVAGALLVPNTLALIMDTFDEDERGSAIGSWTSWTSIATVLGPLGGGALIGVASWRWVFAINVVPVLITLWLLRFAPADQRQEGVRVDWVGGLLAAAGLAGPVLALIEQPSRGFGSPLVAAPGLGGIALLVAFVFWERHERDPMLPLELFRRRNFAVGNLVTLALYAGLGAATFLLALFLQETAGYSALEAGLAMLPLTILMFALARRFGALADRIGPWPFMGFGPLVAGAGLLLLMRVDASGRYAADVLPGVFVFGIGLAVTVAPLTATVLGGADAHHSGVASGVNNAVARVAGLLAIAVVGALCAARFASAVDAHLPAGSLSPQARAAVATAKGRTLVATPPAGIPAGERARVQDALSSASVSAFRLGIGISGLLAIAGGAISLAGIERRRPCAVQAERCPGGALYGAGEEVRVPQVSGRPAPVHARARPG